MVLFFVCERRESMEAKCLLNFQQSRFSSSFNVTSKYLHYASEIYIFLLQVFDKLGIDFSCVTIAVYFSWRNLIRSTFDVFNNSNFIPNSGNFGNFTPNTPHLRLISRSVHTQKAEQITSEFIFHKPFPIFLHYTYWTLWKRRAAEFEGYPTENFH